MHTRIDTDTVYAQHAQPAFNVIRIRRLHLLAFVQYILEKEKKNFAYEERKGATGQERQQYTDQL